MERQLYPGIAFSPQAVITNNIGAADTIIEVSDVSAFPPAPNLATIGSDEEGETILYTAKTSTALSGCKRGVEGTAKRWNAGELIGRNFTAKDHTDLIAAVGEAVAAANLAHTEAKKAALEAENAQVAADTAIQDAESVRQRLSNPNLLINSHFIGGGSQQGGGQFPINQRSETEYRTIGYTIDRWYSNSENLKVTVADKYISLTNTGTSLGTFVQRIENSTKFRGKTVTFSVLTKDGGLYICNADVPVQIPTSNTSIGVKGTDFGELRIWDQSPNLRLQCNINMSVNKTLNIQAMKLELGDQQTLARQEGDTWVLNDSPPNYALELAKCQRYFQKFGNIIYTGFTTANGQSSYFGIDLPTDLRSAPTVSATPVYVINDGKRIADFSNVTPRAQNEGSHIFFYLVWPSNAIILKGNSPVFVALTDITFDSELY